VATLGGLHLTRPGPVESTRDSVCGVEIFWRLRFRYRIVGQGVGIADSALVIAPRILRKVLGHVATLMQLTPLHLGPSAEDALDRCAQAFGPVDHEPVALFCSESPRRQVRNGVAVPATAPAASTRLVGTGFEMPVESTNQPN
jgi:hypothetical protein